MTDKGEFVEVQGTGEERPFSREDLNKLLELGEKGNKELIKAQKRSIRWNSRWNTWSRIWRWSSYSYE